MEMIIIKNGNIYSPSPLGKKDILIGGGKILAIEEEISLPKSITHKIIDANGLIVIPGLIDSHVHIGGAGGEGGPSTRTPELVLSQMLEAGVTGVIGLLGTDGITRNVESVLMKAKSLKEEGVSAWIMTGSYQVPVYSITGDYARDIALIDEVIGVGEIAISDHRCSVPSIAELARIAANARVAGMLAGKGGVVNVHLGDSDEYTIPVNAFQPIYDVCNSTMIPIKQFIPTHCNRNHIVFEKGKEFGKKGNVDFTTSSYKYYPQYEIKSAKALKMYLEAGVPLENITFTSDGNGSLPDFDAQGNLIGLTMGSLKSVFDEVVDAIREEKIPIEKAICVATSNPAKTFKLKGKGNIKEGYDADILMLNKDYQVYNLIARGEIMIQETKMLKKGTFEKK